jgi:hypothetical protein
MMAPKSKFLTREEFASLLTVGNTCAMREPPAVIPAEHSARLIGLGYMEDLEGRLRMTSVVINNQPFPRPAVARTGKIKIVKPFCSIESDGIGWATRCRCTTCS